MGSPKKRKAPPPNTRQRRLRDSFRGAALAPRRLRRSRREIFKEIFKGRVKNENLKGRVKNENQSSKVPLPKSGRNAGFLTCS
jgi:hypothetical protein